MSKPVIVDLGCGIGGCARGYQRAGFYVVGVDNVPQYEYCGDEFVLGDLLTFPLDGFDAIHASPPCKSETPLKFLAAATPRLFDPHLDLLTPMLARLQGVSVPWIVENVPTDKMPSPIVLCGSSFGLKVRRHRMFSSNFPLRSLECRHKEQGKPIGVYGHGGGHQNVRRRGHGAEIKAHGKDAADALGIDWTIRQAGLCQAIPPAYTQFIGEQLLTHLGIKA